MSRANESVQPLNSRGVFEHSVEPMSHYGASLTGGNQYCCCSGLPYFVLRFVFSQLFAICDPCAACLLVHALQQSNAATAVATIEPSPAQQSQTKK